MADIRPSVAANCGDGVHYLAFNTSKGLQMTKQSGFTLLELMIVVAIIGIIAGIGYPAYSDYITRSKLSEAISNLSDMRVKMEQYFLDNRTYVGACATGTVAPLPTGKYFTFTCPTLTATAYTVLATGVSTQGMSGFGYSIDQNNTKLTTAVPTGWTQATNCWTLKKDGSC